MDNVNLILSDARGIYIPRDFVLEFDLSKWSGVSDWARTECADPNNEHYWEAWDEILCNAVYTSDDGRRFALHQDGDVWLINFDGLTADEREGFGFDD